MEAIARGALVGIAFGGFAAAVVEANSLIVQALWRFNCLAAEIAWDIANAPLEGQRRRRQQRLAETEDADDENED